MNEILEAFEELLDAQEESVGERITATVGAVTADCLLGTITTNELLVEGGVAEAGTLEIQMRVSDFEEIPDRYTTATVQGKTLAVFAIEQSHGVYSMTLQDPANV